MPCVCSKSDVGGGSNRRLKVQGCGWHLRYPKCFMTVLFFVFQNIIWDGLGDRIGSNKGWQGIKLLHISIAEVCLNV